MWKSGDIILGRLQARVGQPQGGTDEQVALRLRLGMLLGGADLYPPAMPPSAVMMVQKLKDPLPGRILPDAGAVRADPEWERAVRGALSDLWRRAARPGPAGLVPEEADVVAFTDPAELLACVAAALVRGGGVRWWYQALVSESARSGGRSLTPALVLGADPRLLPALLERLAEWGVAERVLEAIWPTEAMALLAAMTRAYDLPESQLYLSLSGTEPWAGSDLQALAVSRLLPGMLRLRGGVGLSRERRALLGLALALGRQPALVRADGGLAAVLRLWLDAEAVEAAAAQVAAAGMVTREEERLDLAGLEPEEREALGLVQPAADNSPPRWPPIRTAPEPKPAAPPPAPEAAIGGPGPTPEIPAPKPAPAPEPEPETEARAGVDPASGIRTRLAGLFYLINLPVPPAPEGVSPWACLEVLGRGLLTEEQAHLLADPVWAALAELAGREPGDPPGPAGDPHLEGWLEQRLPDVQARLLALLRLGQPDELPDPLLAAPGWLCVTRSHIDIVMELEAISLPVRFAGLDANPGWLPDYGRVIQFHFR